MSITKLNHLTNIMKKALTLITVSAIALFAATTASAEEHMSNDLVINSNEGMVASMVHVTADTGDNSADGSYAGDGGRGGDIRNSGDDVDDSTTGNGGAGGDSAAGGLVTTGAATAEGGAMIAVNSNDTRINRCGCEGEEDGHAIVLNRNRGMVLQAVVAHADSGDNYADGSYAGDGGRAGDIKNKNGDDIDDSATGNGARGGSSDVGGTVFTGPSTSRAGAMILLNSNMTRILR